MDISSQYIKMCEKAGEIQEIAPRDQCSFLPFTTNAYQLPYVLGSDGSFWVKIPKSLGTFGVVWLPRQDQLQEMCEPPLDILLMEFWKWLPRYDVGVKYTSLEQLWLAYIMYKKYRKIWDEERREWIKIKS